MVIGFPFVPLVSDVSYCVPCFVFPRRRATAVIAMPFQLDVGWCCPVLANNGGTRGFSTEEDTEI